MTIDFIAFHAAERPQDVAVIVQGRAITYPEFLADVRRFAAALRSLGLARGDRLAVQCADPYRHWLVLLAADALGLVTLSLADNEDIAATPPQVPLDFILWQQSPLVGVRSHHLTEAWFQQVFAGPGPQEATLWPLAPEDPVRLTRTSGTTGEQKILVASRRIRDAWTDRWIIFYSIVRESRALFHLPFTVASAYTLSLALARAGATLVFESRMPAWQAIAAHGITHLLLVPFSIQRMVEAAPESFVKPERLCVISIGGKVPPPLRAKVRARFAIELSNNYGTNETGTIAASCSDDPDAHLTLRPGMQVEIVDEQDRPLPRGRAGAIRARSPYMFSEYLNDPQATAVMFRNGWFYPGDAGILHASGQLEVVGRSDDVLNIGGAKFTPFAIEEALRALTGGDDVAVSSLPNTDGAEELCIAITGQRLTQHAENLAPFLRGLPGPIHLVPLASIPRTESGKVRREQLRAEVLRVRRAGR